MAKKKSKKSEKKKKDLKKKKLIKPKLSKKKERKKKERKKKERKKKEGKKKEAGKKEVEKKVLKVSNSGVPVARQSPVAGTQVRKTETKEKDHSSNYNVTNAVKKLRTLKSRQELLSFTNGEKRLTVTRAIPQFLNRFK